MEPIFVTYGHRIEPEPLLARVGLEPGTEEAKDFSALAGRILDVAEAGLEKGRGGPAAAYVRASVDYVGGGGRVVLNGVPFCSTLLAQKVFGAEWVYPQVATCGTGLDAWTETIVNPLERYWADEILRCMLDGICEAVKTDVAGRFGETGLALVGPGSFREWGLEGQEGVFSLIGNAVRDIGVVLRDDLLMRPLKSVSGILLPSRGDGLTEGSCPRAGLQCPGRRPGCAGGGCGSCCGKQCGREDKAIPPEKK